MMGIEQKDDFGNYSYIVYLKVAEEFSMQVVLDTSQHKILLAGSECTTCWEDGYIAHKYDTEVAL